MKYILTLDGKRHEMELERADPFRPLPRAERASAPLRPAPTPAHADPAVLSGNTVKSPVPGKILDVFAAPGEAVAAGQPLVLLEAMKMETDLAAPAEGVVREINVKKGDDVTAGQILVLL